NLVKGDTTTVIAKSCSLADSHGNKDPSIASTPNEDLPKTTCSFATVVRLKDSFSKVHFRALINEEKIKSFDCVLPKAATTKVKSRYENSIVSFFVGMDQVVEKGLWLIRKSPIILNKRTASVSLKKGKVTKVHVWVKLYNVPVLAYSKDGLSLIATQIVTMAIPDEEGDGHTKEVIRVVYKWKPPHCIDYQSFGHDTNLCPKHVRDEILKTSAMDAKANTMDENDDGFVEVKSRKKKKGANSWSFGGSSASSSVSTNDNGKGNGCSKPDLNSSNPFDVLNVEGEEMGESGQHPKVSKHVGTVHLNVNKKKAQEPSSSKSAINYVQEDKNVSSFLTLKTWDCINESDTDDEDVIPLYGSSLGGVSRSFDDQRVVDVVARKCSCRKWELIWIPCKHVVAACWNMALNDRETPLLEAWICRPKKKTKRSKLADEPFVKDGKLSKKGRTITCQSCGNIRHNKTTCKGLGCKNTEANDSASGQAQQAKLVVGHDSSGGSGVGAIIGLFVAGGQPGHANVGVESQSSSLSRWTKRRVVLGLDIWKQHVASITKGKFDCVLWNHCNMHEYVSLSVCCAQVFWMRTQLTDYGFHFDKIPMHPDLKAAIAISCNPVQHSRTKHIHLADMFTKALSKDRFNYLVRRLGMRCSTLAELEALANEFA
nr:hypothetical protein [Tanacetum cinerariifolium]